MTDQPEMIDRYELYRVVTDFDGLTEAFRDRVEELQVTQLSLDAAGGLQPGYSGKLLCMPAMKSLGSKSLPQMLKATGMALVLVVDDLRFAEVKGQLAKRKRPMRAMVRRKLPTWLFRGEKASKMGKKCWEGISPEIRKKRMRKVAKARWRGERRKAAMAAKAECVAEMS